MQRHLEDVRLAVDDSRFLALGRQRAVRRRREEPADPGTAGANALGERALRHQFDLDFTFQELPLELLVLADVGGNHLPDLTSPQQDPDPEIVDAGIVADDEEVFRPACVQRAR